MPDSLQPTVLAIASSSEHSSIGLLKSGAKLARVIEAASGAGSSATLFATIDALLAEAQLERHQIDVIAFDQGPGAFTGVRLACSVAQGLAYGLDRPLLAISALELVAADALESLRAAAAMPAPGGLIWTVCDARMSEVYCAVYQASVPDPACDLIDLSPIQSARLYSVSQALEWIRAGSHAGAIAAGNGFARFTELADCAQALGLTTVSDAQPRAAVLTQRARAHWRWQRQLAPAAALPLYVRDKVALNVDEQRQRR